MSDDGSEAVAATQRQRHGLQRVFRRAAQPGNDEIDFRLTGPNGLILTDGLSPFHFRVTQK